MAKAMRSDRIKLGFERAPHRALLKATGVRDEDMGKPFVKPFVAVVNSYVDIVPGHVHLQGFGKGIKQAIRDAGAVPFEFNTIGVDDGIAMGHEGMKFSLPSREMIADCVETMVAAHAFDGMICIPNCGKIVPGMLMAAMRLDIPTIFISGGPMPAGKTPDGRFSGGTRGTAIGHVSPEAAAGGPIGIIRDGDIISIDLDARTLNLDLPEDEFKQRMQSFKPHTTESKSRWLRRYAKLVSSASTGAVFLD